MKKAMAFLSLLLVLSLATGAMADSGNTILFTADQKTQLNMSNDYSSSMAIANNTIYTLWNTSICAWQPGQEIPQVVASGLNQDYFSNYSEAKEQLGDAADALINELVSDGQTLYGLNRLNGSLFPLTFADGKMTEGTPIQLDWTGIASISNSADSGWDMTNVMISEGALYVMVRNYQNYDEPQLYRFSLTDGKSQQINVTNLQDIVSYRDGKILALTFDQQNAYASDGTIKEKPQIAVVDPADGSVTPAGTLDSPDIFGMTYQPETDTLYYTASNQLMAMKAFGQPTVVAYVPAGNTNAASAGLLSGGMYVINTWTGLVIRNTDPQYIPSATLNVYGSGMDDTATSFVAANPQVGITFNQNVYYDTAEQLAQSMTSGDNTFDLFNIDLTYQDFQSLLSKGYCMDLSSDQALTDEMSKMYPFLQGAVQKDGKYFAVPISMYAYGLSTINDTWDKAGLTDKIPTSFMGLIDFMNWWLDEGENAHPDLQLMSDVSDYRQTLFQLAISMYMSDCQANDQPLTLDTPVFQKMLTALDSLDTDALNDTLPATDNSDRGAMDDSNTLFSSYGDWLGIYSGSSDYAKPLVLSLEDGGTQHIPVEINVYFINPNTKNPDLAMKYLEFILTNMDPAQHVMMFPDDNEPVPVQNFNQTVQSWTTELDKQQQKLKTAKPEDVKDIQSSIDSLNDLLKNQDKYRWQVSKETIAQYRSISSLFFAGMPNLLNYNSGNGSSDISTLIDRYIQRQISLTQFLKDADQKIHMIQMEQQ